MSLNTNEDECVNEAAAENATIPVGIAAQSGI
jgi:hypothetical protein